MSRILTWNDYIIIGELHYFVIGYGLKIIGFTLNNSFTTSLQLVSTNNLFLPICLYFRGKNEYTLFAMEPPYSNNSKTQQK